MDQPRIAPPHDRHSSSPCADDTAERRRSEGGSDPARGLSRRGRELRELSHSPGWSPVCRGPPLATAFGVFYPPNITQDPTYGIGQWSFDNFKRALRRGVSPTNTHYYPVFPYASYTGMSDADIAALWAYLRAVPAVAQANRPHEVGFPFNWRILLAPWKIMFLNRGPIEPDPGKSLEWNRGRYLVEAVTHCAECHAPRNLFAAVDRSRYMAGVPAERGGIDGWNVPNITPDPETGYRAVECRGPCRAARGARDARHACGRSHAGGGSEHLAAHRRRPARDGGLSEVGASSVRRGKARRDGYGHDGPRHDGEGRRGNVPLSITQRPR